MSPSNLALVETGQPSPLTEEGFKRISERSPGNPVLQALREHAFKRLQALPFPESRHPLWRHTKPALFDFARVNEAAAVPARLEGLAGAGANMEGIEVLPDIPESVLAELFHKNIEDLEQDSTHYLQLAAAASASFIRVKKGIRQEEPLRLRYEIAKSRCAAPLVIILLEEGACLNLVEELSDGEDAFLLPRLEIILQDNSSLEFVSYNNLACDASYLGRHRLHVGRDVNAKLLHLLLGAQTTRLDIDCNLRGPGSEVELSSVYIADGKRHVDIHTLQDHLAPHCRSDLLSKGVLKDKGRSVFYGMIRVAERAQRTDAYQTNRNLVFSKEARADSIPNLQIKANDVKCSHGATVGQVSEDELFYLMTRGLPRVSAERLLVEGFVDEALLRIKDEQLFDYVHDPVIRQVIYGSAGSSAE